MYSIYLITNKVNSKKYIGFTSRKLQARWKQHISSSKNNSKFLIHKAIRKYGISNFEIEIIYQSLNYDHTLK